MKKNASGISREAAAGTLRKVLAVIGRYKLLLAFSILLAGLTVVLQLYVPILIGHAIDTLIGSVYGAWRNTRTDSDCDPDRRRRHLDHEYD